MKESIAKLLDPAKLVLIGMLMGAADIIPGISGGTIAFITGVYDKLIHSLSRLDFHALRHFYKGQFRQLFLYMNLGFLLRLGLGILISLVSMVHLISYLLVYYPILLWSLFLGLVMASAWLICRHIEHWNVKQFLFVILGFVLAWQGSSAINLSIEPGLLSFFIAGSIAISAMLLPGVSGSFLLLLMGLYQPVLVAIKNLDFAVIFTFGSGCIVGLVCFSKVINWLLEHHAQPTKACLLGLTLGALHKLWPWQVPLASLAEQAGIIKPDVNQQLPVNVLPATFEAITGQSAQIWLVCLLFFVSFISVMLLDRLVRKTDIEAGIK